MTICISWCWMKGIIEGWKKKSFILQYFIMSIYLMGGH